MSANKRLSEVFKLESLILAIKTSVTALYIVNWKTIYDVTVEKKCYSF